MPFEVVVSQILPVDLETAWKLVATEQGWSKWFTSGASFDAVPGATYKTADGDEGEIVEVLGGERIAFSWEHPKHPKGSMVVISVGSVERGSRVEIRHTNVPTQDLANELRAAWNNVASVLANATI